MQICYTSIERWRLPLGVGHAALQESRARTKHTHPSHRLLLTFLIILLFVTSNILAPGMCGSPGFQGKKAHPHPQSQVAAKPLALERVAARSGSVRFVAASGFHPVPELNGSDRLGRFGSVSYSFLFSKEGGHILRLPPGDEDDLPRPARHAREGGDNIHMHTYIHVYTMYMSLSIYIYIYTYVERERERDRHVIYIYIYYIYIYIYFIYISLFI